MLLTQDRALSAGVLEGKSLIVSSGSSTGKTLVAEFAIAKLSSSKKALYIVPQKALADDKYDEFQKYYAELLSIGISTHDRAEFDDRLDELDLLIATYEKAEILVRSNARWAKSIGLLVVDELHHIGDENRGPTMEILITELLGNKNLQFIGLSATIAEPSTFAKWIGGDTEVLDMGDYRPVPLRMGVLYNGKIAYDDGEVEETSVSGGIDAQLAQYVASVVESQRQVLVFASGRFNAEKYSRELANAFGRIDLPGIKRLTDSEIQRFVEQDAISTDVDPSITNSLRKGVGFHHAGLSSSERRFIQESFKQRRLAAVCATTTLAEGVNYPADVTLFTSLLKGQTELTVNDFKNMAGRAGRIGYVKVGTAIVIAITRRVARDAMERYVKGSPQAVVSQLVYERELRRNLMALVASGSYKSLNDILEFLSKTYYVTSTGGNVSKDLVARIYQTLEAGGLASGYRATDLGRVCASRRYDPLTIRRLVDGFREILKTERNFTDFTLLHLACSTADFENALFQVMPWQKGAYVGTIIDRAKEISQTSYKDQEQLERVAKTALVLEAWIEGKPTEEEFGVYPSDIQTNQAHTAIWLCSAIADSLAAAGLPLAPGLVNQIGDLVEQLKYGVPKKYLGVARTFAFLGIDPLSRNRILRLGDEKIDTLRAILDTPSQKLASSLGSIDSAKRVQQKASELLSDPLVIKKQSLVFEAERAGVQGPVLRLFFSRDAEEFERSVYQILRLLARSVGRPGTDRSVSPDFVIARPDGRTVSVECRFSPQELTVTQLGAVLARSLSQKSSVASVIVSPRFSTEAIEAAKNSKAGNKVTLVSDAVLGRVLILGKKVDSEALLLSLIEAGGMPSEDDVEKLAQRLPPKERQTFVVSELAKEESMRETGPKSVSKEKFESAIKGENTDQ